MASRHLEWRLYTHFNALCSDCFSEASAGLGWRRYASRSVGYNWRRASRKARLLCSLPCSLPNPKYSNHRLDVSLLAISSVKWWSNVENLRLRIGPIGLSKEFLENWSEMLACSENILFVFSKAKPTVMNDFWKTILILNSTTNPYLAQATLIQHPLCI